MKFILRTILVSGVSLGVGLLGAGCASTQTRSQQGAVSGQRQDVVLAALSQIGTPYSYGSVNPGAGLDCSGLTYYAHHAAGLDIPRVSLDQMHAAAPLKETQLQAGDLVFFHTGRNVYHVGLMIDSHEFVHASTSQRQVGLASLSTPYWQQHFLGAGTFLNEP